MASENEQIWLDRYLKTGDAIQAVKDTFPDCSEASAPSRASQLKAKLEHEIDQAFSRVMKRDSIKAFKIISDLMSGAKQESIKLKAAMDVLNRAGYNEIHRFEDMSKPQTYEELQTQLNGLINGLDDDTHKQINYLLNNQAGSKQ